MLKIKENYIKLVFLEIAISQHWVEVFQISQSLLVRKALGHILKLNRFHSSCKQNFCVTKFSKYVHLFFQFHITGTVVHDIRFYTTSFRSLIVYFYKQNPENPEDFDLRSFFQEKTSLWHKILCTCIILYLSIQ